MFRNHDFSDGGRAVLIEAPEDDAVALADAKAALGISGVTQDASIRSAIAAAADALDPAAGGWLGRALRPQTWELQLRSFSDCHWSSPNPRRPASARQIILPFPPLLEIVSFKYLDVTGTDRALVLGTDYRVLGQGQVYGKASLAPLYQQSWPVPRVDDASVRIQFTCGYDDDDAVMPKSLKQAIVLGARALLSLSTRDMMLFEDRVEGVGSKRYQNNPTAAAEIVTKAVSSLLVNLAIS